MRARVVTVLVRGVVKDLEVQIVMNLKPLVVMTMDHLFIIPPAKGQQHGGIMLRFVRSSVSILYLL